jgi:hypothetical protein
VILKLALAAATDVVAYHWPAWVRFEMGDKCCAGRRGRSAARRFSSEMYEFSHRQDPNRTFYLSDRLCSLQDGEPVVPLGVIFVTEQGNEAANAFSNSLRVGSACRRAGAVSKQRAGDATESQ